MQTDKYFHISYKKRHTSKPHAYHFLIELETDPDKKGSINSIKDYDKYFSFRK